MQLILSKEEITNNSHRQNIIRKLDVSPMKETVKKISTSRVQITKKTSSIWIN